MVSSSSRFVSSASTFHPTTFYKDRKLEFIRFESLFTSLAPSTGPNPALFILPITTLQKKIPTLARKPRAVPEDENISLSLDRDEEETEDVEKKGTIAGAVALIIGTSIGSGILALPQRAAPAGIVPSSVCMVTCWAFLLIEALLLVEVNTSLWKRRRRRRGKGEDVDELGVISIRTMARDTLGEWGGTLTTVAYVFMGYTTMVAYCSKSGEILCDLINVPAPLSGIFFTVVFGLLISVGGTRATDRVNKLLTVAMIGLLVAIEMVAVASRGWSGDVRGGDWAKVPAAIPVMIFSLVYHDVAPVICAYLDGDLTRIRNSVLLGSLVPLLALLVWDAVALGQSRNEETLIDPVLLLVRGGGGGVSMMVEAFSLLAVGTSLIGTLLGFSEFFKEQLVNLKTPSPKVGSGTLVNDIASRILLNETPPLPIPLQQEEASSTDTSPSITNQKERKKRSSLLPVALVVCPSLLISTSVPDAFSAATDIAGGYCMTMLYGVLPPAMAWAMRRRGGGGQGIRPELVVGSGVFAVALVLEQLVQDFFVQLK